MKRFKECRRNSGVMGFELQQSENRKLASQRKRPVTTVFPLWG
jgi:hypothetical protein